MAADTKANTAMIKNKDLESLFGLMEEPIAGTGKMGSKMGRDATGTKKG